MTVKSQLPGSAMMVSYVHWVRKAMKKLAIVRIRETIAASFQDMRSLGFFAKGLILRVNFSP